MLSNDRKTFKDTENSKRSKPVALAREPRNRARNFLGRIALRPHSKKKHKISFQAIDLTSPTRKTAQTLLSKNRSLKFKAKINGLNRCDGVLVRTSVHYEFASLVECKKWHSHLRCLAISTKGCTWRTSCQARWLSLGETLSGRPPFLRDSSTHRDGLA